MQETIVVEQVGQFGVRAGEKWYGVYEPLKPSDFIAGQSYDVVSAKSKTGKSYIKQLTGNTSSVKTAKEKPGDDKILSKGGDDYIKRLEDKNEQIKRQGLIQATLQSPGLVAFASNAEEYWNLVQNFAERGIKFVENNQ